MSYKHWKSNIVKDLEEKGSAHFKNIYENNASVSYLRRLRRELIIDTIGEIQGCDNVLDVGCGPSILYEELLHNTTTYYALDLVKANLEEIKNKHNDKNIQCILGDIDTFEWERCYFDIIICSGSLEYTEHLENNLRKLISLLKPRGIFVASLPNILSPYRLWCEYVYKYVWYVKNKFLGKNRYLYPRYLMRASRVKRVCQQTTGIDEVAIKYFGYKLLFQPLDQLFRSTDYRIVKRLQKNPIKWLSFTATEFLVIVRK